MSSSGRFDPAVLCGGVSATAITTAESRSAIGAETPGLQSVLSWRSSGSIFSDGADRKRGVLHRMELRTKEAAYGFAATRDQLTACVEILEETTEEIAFFYRMMLPPEIVKHRDLFERIWGWERFFPVYNLRYLEEYYRRNAQASLGGQQPILSLNSLVYLCCKKETELVSEWRKQGFGAASPEIRLSTRIQKKIINLVLPKKNKPIIPPVILDCINCIIKEAELILVGMREGFHADDCDLGHHIRDQVFCLIKKYLRADPCSASVAICAVLLGTMKEAELICEKLRREALLYGEHTLSTSIRSLALGMLADDMDIYALKMATTAGFCYRDHFDPAAIDMPTWYEREQPQYTELGKVHVDGSHELSKEKHSTKNKPDDAS